METIGALEAKTRFSELLERTQHGEEFQITDQGRAVGKLVPPDAVRNPNEMAAAVKRLKGLKGLFGDLRKDEVLAMRHEGHRY